MNNTQWSKFLKGSEVVSVYKEELEFDRTKDKLALIRRETSKIADYQIVEDNDRVYLLNKTGITVKDIYGKIHEILSSYTDKGVELFSIKKEILDFSEEAQMFLNKDKCLASNEDCSFIARCSAFDKSEISKALESVTGNFYVNFEYREIV